MDGGISLTVPAGEDIVDYKKRPLHHTVQEDRKEVYDNDIIVKVQCLYLVASVLWVVLIYIAGLLDNNDYISWFFLALPLLVYMINYNETCHFTVDLENEMFKGNFLSFGYLIVIIFINWNKVEQKNKLFKILILALVFIMLSMVDLWVGKDQLVIAKHFRSILQTGALSLLAYALYLYYLEQSKGS